MRKRRYLVGLTLVVLASSASAEGQLDASSESPSSTTVTVPPPPPDMVEAPPLDFGAPPERKGLEVGFTWAIQLGIPVFLDVPRSIVKPGADLSFFAGADFGYFMIGGAMGIGWNPINLDGVAVTPPGGGPQVVLSGRSPLTRLFLSVPEFRVQIDDLKVALPYISGAFDINFWNFRETEVGCGFYYCSEFSVYRFTPGFTGRGGVALEIKRGIHIDVGLRYSFTGKGDFFEQSRWYLVPYVGVLVRRRD